jgi:hypothetical protein
MIKSGSSSVPEWAMLGAGSLAFFQSGFHSFQDCICLLQVEIRGVQFAADPILHIGVLRVFGVGQRVQQVVIARYPAAILGRTGILSRQADPPPVSINPVVAR